MKKHYFNQWYLRTAFDCDYGTFVCDKCSCVFHHSPSSITYGTEEDQKDNEIYNCCCGNCTNKIIANDWGQSEKPYN